MKTLDAYARLLKLAAAVFQTSDAAACLGLSHGTTSKLLSRLSVTSLIIRLCRGHWAFQDRTDPLVIPEHLTAPWPSYISLQTALHYHGYISQVPSVIYCVSLGRTRLYRNVLGVFSVHQIKPDFFFGYETMGATGIKMATPEKALLDLLYLSPARSGLFASAPEVTLPARFRVGKAREMIQKITSKQRRGLVSMRFESLLERTSR